MLTRQEILNYHVRGQKRRACGFEFEMFCFNRRFQRLFFRDSKRSSGLQNVFNYLIRERGFKELDSGKTIGVEKDGVKFSLEPGSQLEYSTKRSQNATALIKEFLGLLKYCSVFQKRLALNLSDLSLFPFGGIDRVPLLAVVRYRIMDKYLQDAGTLGRTMMRNTTSLQLTFNYESRQDLEEKVNRLLFLKPVLLPLSSNSRVRDGEDSQCRSFRELVWQGTDPSRCGDPGRDFWAHGRWTIEDYIEKVLDATVIFDVANRQYNASYGRAFHSLMDDLESYVFHNSTIFTDIRIKNYVEMRYLDNPTILLVPGMMLFVESILYDDKTWELLRNLPYKFREVPALTRKLNSISEESFKFWDQAVKPVLATALKNLKELYPRESHFYFDALITKINMVGDLANLKMNPEGILENSIIQFNNNLAKLLDRTAPI